MSVVRDLATRALARVRERPVVILLAGALGFVVLFPRIGAREVVLSERLPACATELAVSAFDGARLLRSHRRSLRGESVVRHSFELPEGRYRLVVELGCGQETKAVERTLVLEEDGEVALDLSEECGC